MSLEDKVKNTKPHWSQWLPGYGAIRLLVDAIKNKPTVINDNYKKNHSYKYLIYGSYQFPFLFAVAIGACYWLSIKKNINDAFKKA